MGPLLALALLAGPAAAETCSLDEFKIGLEPSLSSEQRCLIRDDLRFLKGLELQAPGRTIQWMFQLSGEPKRAGAELADWIARRTTRLSRGGVQDALAANLGLASRTGQLGADAPWGAIILTDAFFQASRMRRLGTYVHEARHSDGDAHLRDKRVDADHPSTAHQHCRTVRIGKPAPGSKLPTDHGCDPDILGAYGYEAVFMANLAQGCASCGEAEKREAGEIARSAFFSHHLELPGAEIPR